MLLMSALAAFLWGLWSAADDAIQELNVAHVYKKSCSKLTCAFAVEADVNVTKVR